MECQTDAFLDRPATPLFIPAKTGRDVATQIWEGDLFDFDIEVKPMLEVLVGKTIEQALLEVMEEEELASLRAHQYAYHELRYAELAEVQRLEEQERRHKEEKERRKKQQLEVLQKEKETSEKIAARAFAQRYLADLIPSVFGSLRDSGYFYDPVERDIETGFFPWLMEGVESTTEKKILGRVIADNLIRDVMEERLDCYEQKRLPYRPEVVLPPDQEPEAKLSGETLVTVSEDEPSTSDQPLASDRPPTSDQPADSDQPPASDQPPTSDLPPVSDQLEDGGQSGTPDLPQIPDPTQTAGQGTAEPEPETKEPEPE
uniref:Uncharacterized protein n=1 Tax=Salvator merianae TaxID=96440 RepID=A0A8D0E1X5_SALMN